MSSERVGPEMLWRRNKIRLHSIMGRLRRKDGRRDPGVLMSGELFSRNWVRRSKSLSSIRSHIKLGQSIDQI